MSDDRLENDRERLEDLFLRVFGRPADEHELEEALQYLKAFPELETQSPAETTAPGETLLDSWASFCQALLSTNEFLFLN